MISPKPHHDASNPRDAETLKAMRYADEGKIVPLVKVITGLCVPLYANDSYVGKAIEYCAASVLEKGTCEDIRNLESALKANRKTDLRAAPFSTAAKETLLNQISQKLLQDQRFADAKVPFVSGTTTSFMDRFRPPNPTR